MENMLLSRNNFFIFCYKIIFQMKGIIYKVTLLCDNRCYIGQTIQEFSKRKASHK